VRALAFTNPPLSPGAKGPHAIADRRVWPRRARGRRGERPGRRGNRILRPKQEDTDGYSDRPREGRLQPAIGIRFPEGFALHGRAQALQDIARCRRRSILKDDQNSSRQCDRRDLPRPQGNGYEMSQLFE